MPFLFQSQPSKDGEEEAKVGKWGQERKGSARGNVGRGKVPTFVPVFFFPPTEVPPRILADNNEFR